MTERQHNSKLLSDKLSSLPVPPNEALWSRIEVQLLAVPPTVQQLPAKPLAKAAGLKITIAVVATVLITVCIIWVASKKAPQRSSTPTTYKAKQPTTVPSGKKADTAIVQPAKPIQESKPLAKPTPLPTSTDTQLYSPTIVPNRKTVDLPLRDTVAANTPPATATLRADSIKLPPPPKKDEGYYFEVKKKKG
jgi:hypothetical protein